MELANSTKKVIVKKARIISLAAVKAGIRITPKEQVVAEKAKMADEKMGATQDDVRAYKSVFGFDARFCVLSWLHELVCNLQ